MKLEEYQYAYKFEKLWNALSEAKETLEFDKLEDEIINSLYDSYKKGYEVGYEIGGNTADACRC